MRACRRAEATDSAGIMSLFASVIADIKRHGGSHWSDDYPTKEILLDDLLNNHVLIMLDQNQVIAAITLVPGPNPIDTKTEWAYEEPCELDRLCVAPAYRGKGLGRTMMSLMSDYARSIDFKSTRHYASKVNTAANALYRKMDYRNAGEVELYGQLFIAYEKKL